MGKHKRQDCPVCSDFKDRRSDKVKLHVAKYHADEFLKIYGAPGAPMIEKKTMPLSQIDDELNSMSALGAPISAPSAPISAPSALISAPSAPISAPGAPSAPSAPGAPMFSSSQNSIS